MDDARVYKAFEENGIYAGVNSMKELKKRGKIVMQEKAQCAPKFDHNYDMCLECTAKIMTAYNQMKPEDQRQYLKLRNKFIDKDYNPPMPLALHGWRIGVHRIFPHPELVIQVTEIFSTNNIQHPHYEDLSVSIEASKFKHSCSANCVLESVPTEDGGWEFTIRNVSRVIQWDYLTVNRFGHDLGMQNLAARRKYLLENHGFKCECDLCQIEENNGDNYRYELYQNFKAQSDRLLEDTRKAHEAKQFHREEEIFRRGVACYREMYKYAKECDAPRSLITDKILKEGLRAAIRGHIHCILYTFNKKQQELFKNESEAFAKAGLAIDKIVSGTESDSYRFWIARSGENFEEYVKQVMYSGAQKW